MARHSENGAVDAPSIRIPFSSEAEEKRAGHEAIALEIGAACDALNKALYRAWNAELSLTVDLVTPKFHAMEGLILVDASAFVPLPMLDGGRRADTPSLVARALGDIE